MKRKTGQKPIRVWREFLDPRQPDLFDIQDEELVLKPSPRPPRRRRKRASRKAVQGDT